jgi:hypothetical protein
MSETTPPSAVFAFADEVVDRLAKSDPLFATEAGIPGYERLLPDFSTVLPRKCCASDSPCGSHCWRRTSIEGPSLS